MPDAGHLLWAAAVLAFGAAVGASEILARYKDAPFTALRTVWARTYIVANAAAALVAYVLIVQFDAFGGDTGNKELLQALVAGFGSMVFFRSALFTVKVGEVDVAVGPALFFQILLAATDRQCDRERAEPRSDLVAEIMRGVSFERARDALPSFCFELMQNVPPAEQQEFRQVVDALASSPMRENVKILNLGLLLINVVGGQVLRAAVRTLGEKIQGPAALELPVLGLLQTADFQKAFPLLVDLCFIMSRYGSDEERSKARDAAIQEMTPLLQRADVDNATKMTFLGLSLQQRVGDAVLVAALAHIADGIHLQSDRPGSAEPPAIADPASARTPGSAAAGGNVVALPANPEAADTGAPGAASAPADR